MEAVPITKRSSLRIEPYVSHKVIFHTDHHAWSMGHLCLAAAAADPERIAVSDGRTAFTYAGLHRFAGSLAYSLRRRGVARHERVMVFATKDAHSVAAILAVLLAGATYVPVDDNVPLERLRLIRDASGAKRAVCVSELNAEIAGLFEEVVDVRAFEPFDLPHELFQRLPRIAPDQEAYVLFTSGSTGTPKGVRIPHRGVAAFFRNVADLMAMKPGARCLNTSPFHYDVSLIDTFFPLANGGTVHVSPRTPYPGYVLKTIERQRITHMCGVGSTLNILARAPEFGTCDLSSLRRIMTGAEVLDPATLQRFLAVAPDLGIINGYGPTEASCGCVGFLVTSEFDFDRADIPIGKVMGDIPLKVLDDGELLIGGDQVMLGYVDGDDSRLSVSYGITYFHSGDIVSIDGNGDYVFRGRKDRGVKIRGHRVHLEELEGTFLRFPGVEGAVSTVHGEGEAAKLRLMLAGELSREDAAALVERSRDYLPTHMVPERVEVRREFPLLPSGKVDRRTLESELATLR